MQEMKQVYAKNDGNIKAHKGCKFASVTSRKDKLHALKFPIMRWSLFCYGAGRLIQIRRYLFRKVYTES